MSKLENNEWLKEKVVELDQSLPDGFGDPEEVWQRIQGKRRKTRQTKFFSAIAASICLTMLGAITFLRQSHTQGEVLISYRVEESDSTKYSIELNEVQDQEAIHFIEDQCEAQNPICHTTIFIELKLELEALNLESAALDKKLIMFGNDPAFVRAQVIIENQKVQIIKDLIQLITS